MCDHTCEFVNRAYELDQICRPGTPRFIVVDGAAGYGKTYLLHKIKEAYEKREREVWKAALVDLKSDPQMGSEDSDISWPCIAKAAIQQFKLVKDSKPIIPVRADEAGIAGALVPFLAVQEANVLLLFDGIEALSLETSAWLKRLVYDLDRGLERGRRELRVVFAGRCVGDWRRGASYKLPALSLSPFDRMVVRDMVEQVAANMRVRPDYLDDLAWWALCISGGHPRGICDVLEVISKAGFIFPDLEFTFFQQQFSRNGQDGTLFELCITPIIDEILADVPRLLREVLAAISPIRRFDQELMDKLLNRGVIIAPGHQSSWDLIRALLQTRLISPPAGDPMFSDQIVRRMLAMQLQIRDAGRWQQINECAQEVFHSWARGSDPVGADIRRVAILESLYHTLQLEPQGASPNAIQERLKQKLDEYLAEMRDLRAVYQLRYALNQDQELNDLIDRRVGSGTVQVLLDIIDHHLSLE